MECKTEGRIDKLGSLLIKRGSKWKRVRCENDKTCDCNDACACFGEPLEYNKKVYLDLCLMEHIFGVFTDERE